MELTGTADAVGAVPMAGHRSLSPTLAAFLQDWQPRQRRTAGYQAMLFTRLDALSRAHPEWADYDFLTHILGALHLIIENDRLTGGHTREQIVDELAGLVALEQPEDTSTQLRIPIESDHLFRSISYTGSGVSVHPAGGL